MLNRTKQLWKRFFGNQPTERKPCASVRRRRRYFLESLERRDLLAVALLGAPNTASWLAEVENQIVSTGLYSAVQVDTLFVGGPGGNAAPSLATLSAYDAVLVFRDAAYADSVGLGNTLASYVNSGRGVVEATFSFGGSFLGGTWDSGGYRAFNLGGQAQPGGLTLGAVAQPAHPVMSGVTTFNGGTSSYHNTGGMAPGSSLVASWSNGQPLVVERPGFAGRIVGLNFYPPSTNSRADFWVAGTDGGRLMANALQYASNISSPGGLIYRTSIDSGAGPSAAGFEVYNTATNTWTARTPYQTDSQMAVSGTGVLYARNELTGFIQSYNAGTDTWTDVMPGPVGGAGLYGNLEISSSGRFFYNIGQGGSNLLYFTTAPGVWSSVALPSPLSPSADYDATTNSVYVSQSGSTVMYRVDANTLAVTTYSGNAVGVGELRRFGEVLNGQYYTMDGVPNIVYSNDVSSPAIPQVQTAFGGIFGSWPSATANSAASLIYMSSLSGTGTFGSWNPITNAVVPLASPTIAFGNHSSLAFVSGAPPATSTRLFAVSGAGGSPSTLYELNPTDGSVISTIGATGFAHITDIAVHPTTGVLYAVSNSPQVLLTINTTTGVGTVVGPTNAQIPDIGFRSDGTLYGWVEFGAGGGDDLATINLTTGAVSIVSSPIGSFRTGLAFDAANNLYVKTDTLFQVNPATGAVNSALGLTDVTNDVLEIGPGNVFYTATRNSNAGPSSFQTINPATGLVTTLGTTPGVGITGLAFTPGPVAPPAPNLTLDGSNNLVFTDVIGVVNDSLTVQSDVANSRFVVTSTSGNLITTIAGAIGTGTPTVTIPFASVAGPQIIFNTAAGNDTLTESFALGNFAKTVVFNGGGNADTLNFSGGGPVPTATFNYTNSTDGSVVIGTNNTIYTGLSPITSTVTAANVVLNYSATGETIAVTAAGPGQTTVSSTAGETTTFPNPTASLTINAGDTGNDSVDVSGLGSGFNAALTIDGGTGTDAVAISTALNLSAAGAGLIVSGETITLNGGSITTNGSQTYNGAVVLGLNTTTNGANVAFNGPVNSGSAGSGYLMSTPGFNFIDISSTGTFLPLSDDQVIGGVPIGFSFNFYGTPFANLGVSSNGFVNFTGDLNSACCAGQPIPTPGTPDGIIAAYWNDLYPPGGGGGVYYQTMGAPGSRVFITSYEDIDNCCGGTSNHTFQIQLFEGSNNIEVHYLKVNNDGSQGSAGVEDLTGSTGTQFFLGTADIPDLTAVRYTFSTGGARSLIVNSPGVATFGGAVGGTNPLNTLSVTAASVSAGSIATTTAVNISNTDVTSAITGAISGAGSTMTKSGAGTLTLSGVNTYTGVTNINSGVVNIAGAGTISTASTINVNNTGTLRFSRNDTWGNHTSDVSSPIIINAGGVVESGGFYNTLVNLTLNGGVLALTGGVNPSFPAFALKGTVTVGGSQASQINVVSGGNNLINVGDDTLGPTVFDVANSTGDANADLIINSPLKDNAFGGIGITKNGVGTLTLTAANTYGGPTTINAGVVNIAGAGTISTASTINVNNTGTLRFSRNDTWGNHTSDVSSPIIINAGGVVESGGFYNTLVNLTLNGGVLALTGGVNPSFPAFALKGTVTVGGSQASQINVVSGANNLINVGDDTLGPTVFNVANSTGNPNADLLINAPLKDNAFGGIGITKGGVGTLTLTAANTYGGPTAINAGVMLVNGANSGTGTTTASTTGVLGGTGSLAGPATINSTGRLAPGASPETLDTGSLTLTAGSFFDVEIGGTIAGTQYDQVNVTGAVNLGNANLNLLQFSGFTVSSGVLQTYTIISNDGADAVTGTFNGLTEGSPVTYAGGTVYVSYNGGDGNDVVLNSQPIVNGGGGGDTLVLRQVSGNPAFVEFSFNAAPFVQVTSALPFTYNGNAGTDLMLVDVLNGDPIPTGNVTFTGEILNVQRSTGAASDAATYQGSGTVGTATVTLAGFGSINASGTIVVDFINLTSVNVQSATANDTWSVADSATGNNGGAVPAGYSIVSSPALLVTGPSTLVTLRNVTSSTLDTVTGGTNGNDTININSGTTAHGNTNLTITTSTGTDVVTVAGALTVGGNLTISSQNIAVNATLTGGAAGTADLNAGSGAITTSGTGIDVVTQSLIATATTGINIDTTVTNITATNSGAGNIIVDETDGANVLNAAAAGGQTTVTSVTGNLNVTTVSATTAAFIIANAGSITDANAAASNVTAPALTAVAGTGIDLDTTITTLTNANVTGTGAIDINDTAAGLIVTSAITNNGPITLNATGGDLTLTTVTAGGTANILATTTTSGNVFAGNVTATSDTITVTSMGAIEELGADAGADLSANILLLTAVSGIGAAAQLEVDGNTTAGAGLTASVTSPGAINIRDIDGLRVNSAVTNSGNITLEAANGGLTLTTVTAGGAGSIVANTLGGTGNISIGALTATGDSITLSAFTNISDGNAAANNADALNLVMLSTSGIGTLADPIESTVSNLEAVGGTGGVFIANTGALNIGGIGATVGISATGGDIVVSTAGAMTVAEDVTATGANVDVTLTTIDAAAAGQNLTLSGGISISSAAASVTLNAGDNATIIGNITSGTITTINVDSGDAESVGPTATAGDGGTLTITGVISTPLAPTGGAYLNGGNDYDTFTFNPQTTTEFFVDGDQPVGTTVGDILQMNVTITVNPNLTVPGSNTIFNGKAYNGPGSGAFSFDPAHRTVRFKSIEDAQITGNYHLTYDNTVAPVGNLVIMLDGTASPNERLQFRDSTTAGAVLYQTTLSPILSVRVLGGAGPDMVTIDDINGLPSFGGSVPLSTGVGNNPLTSDTDATPAPELFFDAGGGLNILNLNLNLATTSQQVALGTGSGPGTAEGEVQSTNSTTGLNAYFRGVAEVNRTGIGAAPGTLTVFADDNANSISLVNNGGGETRVAATGYVPFDFSGNNYSALVVNALVGTDLVDLVGFGAGQTNNPPITLNGGADADTIRVRSTSGNTGLVTLNGNAGSDLFQLFDAANMVDNIAGQVVVDGTDGNVGGNTDTLTIVDSGDGSFDSVVISAVNPGTSADYALEGATPAAGNDVTFRNVDVLNYTSTSAGDTIDGRFVNTSPPHDLNTVNLSGWVGADQFLLFVSDQIGGSGAGFTPSGVASGLADINLFGDAPGNPNAVDGNDIFGLTPVGLVGTGVTNVGLVVPDTTRMIRPSASTTIAIDGGQPTGLIPPMGDAIGDVLNTDISGLPNTTPVIVSTFAPGTVVAAGIQPFTWTQIEDINLVDQHKLTNVQMGDLFARTTPGADLIQIMRNPTQLNPNQVRLRINATIGNYSVSNKTIMYGGGQNDTLTQSNLTVPAEFYGEDGDDYLTGALNNDWLVGGLGDDRVNGSGGDNIIWGDNAPTLPTDPNPQDLAVGGNDQLSGLAGADVIYGGGGDDLVNAGGGNDYIQGGQGNDNLGGDDGDDRLYGGLGNDTLSGHAGNDLLSGGGGDDFLYGNTGNDVMFGGVGIDNVDGGEGNDLLVSGSVANETSSRTSLANTATYSSATYTNAGDNDAALVTLLALWGGSSNRTGIGAISHDGADDDLFGGLGDDDFCWELADLAEDPFAIFPSDFNAAGYGTDERFGPIA